MKKRILLSILALLVVGAQAYYLINYAPDRSIEQIEETEPTYPVIVTVTDIATPTDITATDISETDTEEEAPVVIPSDADLNQYAVVTVKSAVIRKKADTEAKVLISAKKGSKVVVLDQKDKWYKVTYKNQTGWTYGTNISLERNYYLEAMAYKRVPMPKKGKILSLKGTAAAHYIDQYSKSYGTTGLTLAVIKDGEVAYHYEYGFADKGKTRRTTESTKFRIASISKVFTSMMAMKLCEEGKLDLDSDVGSVLGIRVRNPRYPDSPISTRMLLTHTAGFHDRATIFSGSITADANDKNAYYTGKPGTAYHYSNLGLGMAGAVVEKVSGKVLSQYAQEAFFTPMGVDASFDGRYLKEKSDVADCLNSARLELSAAQAVEDKDEKEPGENNVLGAGGLLISAEDMARVACILLGNGTYQGNTYLKPETVAAMQTVQRNCSGYKQCIGIRYSDKILSGRNVYYHPGAAYGIYSVLIYDPADASGVVVLSTGAKDMKNSNGVRNVCLHAAEYVYSDVIERKNEI